MMENLMRESESGRRLKSAPVQLFNQITEDLMMNVRVVLSILVRVVLLVVMAFILLVSMQSCQNEGEVIVDPPSEDVITTESPVYGLLLSTTKRDGSYDNILDKSSCTSIVLPITVFVDNKEININSEDDFIELEKILDEMEADQNALSFAFPITIILKDHSEVTIENVEQLKDFTSGCIEDGKDDDIECIDLKYPIELSIYNTENQVKDVVEIENDEELYLFLNEMTQDDLVGIEFPITVFLSDGTEITVDDNIQLKEILQEARNDCDEDDDNDYNDDDADDSKLVKLLIEGRWYISLYKDKLSQAGIFEGFLFNFYEDGKAVAYNTNKEIHGEWDSSGDDGTLRLELSFGEESPFSKLKEDWVVMEAGENIIKLAIYRTDSVSEKVLNFERPKEPVLPVTDILKEGQWVVAKYEVAGEVETYIYSDFKIDFKEEGEVVATNGNDVIEGEWGEVKNVDTHKLTFNFGETVPFNALSSEWKVVSYRENRVEIKTESDTGINVLVFEKLE